MVQTAVHCYHVYKDVWTHSISKEFICYQEQGNNHVRHAVAVHGGEGVLGQLPRKISSVAFFFLECDGCITGNGDSLLEAAMRNSNTPFFVINYKLNTTFWCMLEILSHKTTHIIIAVKVHSKIKKLHKPL